MTNVAVIIDLNIIYMDADYSEKVAMTLKATPRINLMKSQSTWLPL